MKGRSRTFASLLAVLAMLFTQAVLAAHAADSMKPACHSTEQAIVACVVHCAGAPAAVDSSLDPVIAIQAAAFVRVVLPKPVIDDSVDAGDPALAHALSPSITIRYRRFRD